MNTPRSASAGTIWLGGRLAFSVLLGQRGERPLRPAISASDLIPVNVLNDDRAIVCESLVAFGFCSCCHVHHQIFDARFVISTKRCSVPVVVADFNFKFQLTFPFRASYSDRHRADAQCLSPVLPGVWCCLDFPWSGLWYVRHLMPFFAGTPTSPHCSIVAKCEQQNVDRFDTICLVNVLARGSLDLNYFSRFNCAGYVRFHTHISTSASGRSGRRQGADFPSNGHGRLDEASHGALSNYIAASSSIAFRSLVRCFVI